VFLQEDINFLLTNRIPRRYATLFVAWFARIRSPRLAAMSVYIWSRFADLKLDEARTRQFATLRDCFIRELRDGARRFDPDPRVAASPCDALVGACGSVCREQAVQAKGLSYSVRELLKDDTLLECHEGGSFVTLRLRAEMYHRFHAPCTARVRRVKYISGDTWNVNPIALRRVENLFCKNERAVVPLELSRPGSYLTLVPVAAILVGGIRLRCVSEPLNLSVRGSKEIRCDGEFHKGDELGYFESGSTILVFASKDFKFAPNIVEGATIRAGEPLFHHADPIANL